MKTLAYFSNIWEPTAVFVVPVKKTLAYFSIIWEPTAVFVVPVPMVSCCYIVPLYCSLDAQRCKSNHKPNLPYASIK